MQQPEPKQDAPLKVVHLCTTDFGGAGKAAYRLHLGLRASGIDSIMLVANRKSTDESVRVIPSGLFGGIVECPHDFAPNHLYARRVWEHWKGNVACYPELRRDIEVFTDDYSEIRLGCSREIRDADIINLHWIPGVVNWVDAAVALKGKKVVWTMHDMNPFTGGCHYSASCTRYTQSCGGCPMLGSNSDEDLSRSIWQFKKFGYEKLDLHPVAPSRWLARAASQSALLSKFTTRVIPNGFPTGIFKPSPRREEVRQGYGVPAGAKVVMFGAESLLTERKGFIFLLEALKGMVKDRIVLAVFGMLPEEVQLSLGLPLIKLGFVEDETTLAALYSMADVFVIPSIEDNLPNTVVEAMLCGVPVVGFDIGGIPDMIAHGETGFIAPARDVRALAEGIRWCLFGDDTAALGRRAHEKAYATYSLEAQAASYTALYDGLLAPTDADAPVEKGFCHRGPHSPTLPQDANRAAPPASVGVVQAGSPVDKVHGFYLSPPPPRISLVVPSYNYGRYLGDCLDSILSQNYPNLELLILDGGSTDDSISIIKRYECHISFWRSHADGGQYSAIEEGFRRSTGGIMTWLNADDMFHADAFKTVSEIFASTPEVEWLMGRPNSFDEEGRQKVVLSFLPMNSRAKYLADQELIQQEGVFWRRGLWERSGGYLDKGLRLAADLELWARFFRSARLFSVDTLIAGFRDHPLQKSKDKAAYTAEANLVLARERRIFADEKIPFSPPAPLPILVGGRPRSSTDLHSPVAGMGALV